MASVFKAPKPAPDFGAFMTLSGFDWKAHSEAEAAYMADLTATAIARYTSAGYAKVDPAIGRTIRFGRGDGYAVYMVWDVKPLRLIWIETGDAWSVESALIRGLRISDVRRMIKADDSIAKLFGKSKESKRGMPVKLADGTYA